MDTHKLTGDVSAFVLGGNATITLQSSVTRKRYTYNIKRHKENESLYFIHLLRGPDNTDDYSYIGCYYSDNGVFVPCRTWKFEPTEEWPASLKAISYLLKNIYNVPSKLHVYHEGKCARCGRKLTTPESIITGFGPECRRLTN